MPNMENVPVSVRLTPDGRFYQAGFEIHGQFQPFTFAEWPASSFDHNVAEAARQEQAKAAQNAESHPSGQ